jgi:uncharacterized protein (TIGR03086 family)
MDSIDFGPVAQRLADLIARCTDDELAQPTPCPAYTLGDLIEHVGGLARAFSAAAQKDYGPLTGEPRPGDASQLEDGWRARIPADLAGLAKAWREPGAWAGTTRIAGMESPAETVGLVLSDELAVHGWDLARATGQPYDCEPEVLEGALSFLGMFASPDAPSGPDVQFGPSRELAGERPLLERVLALAGRDPHWPQG